LGDWGLSQACLQPHATSPSVAAEHIRKQLALLHSRLVKCHGRALPVTSDLYNMRTAVETANTACKQTCYPITLNGVCWLLPPLTWVTGRMAYRLLTVCIIRMMCMLASNEQAAKRNC